MKQALLIIDVQNDYFKGGKSELFEPEIALKNIDNVLENFRRIGKTVIHVQHINTRPNATFFLPNTEGVKIHQMLTPLESEYLVEKHYPNSFLKTELESIIKKEQIEELIICGMMTHMCIDTTTRACMDYGLKATVLEDCCATKNLVFQDVIVPATTVQNTFMASLNGLFAEIMSSLDYLGK